MFHFRRSSVFLLKTTAVFAGLSFSVSACQPGPSKDPLDCANPACADTLDMFKKALRAKSPENNDRDNKNNSNNSGMNNSSVKDEKSLREIGSVGTTPGIPKNYKGCPADKEKLGASTWLLLHTMASSYPEEPSEEYQELTKQFIHSLAQLYPCSYCAKDFQKCVALSPPQVTSREAFSLWVCARHNEVNEKLNRAQFPCTMAALDERWLHGERSCWDTLEDEVSNEVETRK